MGGVEAVVQNRGNIRLILKWLEIHFLKNAKEKTRQLKQKPKETLERRVRLTEGQKENNQLLQLDLIANVYGNVLTQKGWLQCPFKEKDNG
ncbi:UNVERIFIED_CONTAM: hypothetical protein FKN15_007786 [Acipenser sinensis]